MLKWRISQWTTDIHWKTIECTSELYHEGEKKLRYLSTKSWPSPLLTERSDSQLPTGPSPGTGSNRLPQSVSQKWVCITLRSRWAEEKWWGTDGTYYTCYHTLKTCLSILRKKEAIINIVSRALTKELWVEWRKGQFWKVLMRRSSQDSLTDRKWGLDEYRNKDIVNVSSLLLDMKVKYLIAVKWKKS